MQWRKLAFLVVVAFVLVGLAVAWSSWRRAHTPKLPPFIPLTPESRPPR